MKNNQQLLISVIIPFKETSAYLSECLKALLQQSYSNFEIILLPDFKGIYSSSKIRVFVTGPEGPAEKRDLGVRKSKGEILAFIDDDAYPDKNWIFNAVPYFQNHDIAAVCGPGITPFSDSTLQKAGGFVNSLWFGSGGAGTYRFKQGAKRYVDDYPSMNFMVRRTDFMISGGFDTHFWPGEDTKLCHDLIYKLKKKIIYDPEVLVYHHRKPLFLPHLKQISRFAIHRGHFAKVLPATSLRIGYLLPTVFVAFLLLGPFFIIAFPILRPFYIAGVFAYLILLISNVIYVMMITRDILVALATGAGIFLTHLIYGLLFPLGFIKKSLSQ